MRLSLRNTDHQTQFFTLLLFLSAFLICDAIDTITVDTAWLRKRLSTELYHDVLSRPSLSAPGDKCTAIAVGRKGTADGSCMNTHTADCAECDWRINKVPAMDWPEGSQRPVYVLTGEYPRQVRSDRGFTWTKENLENASSHGSAFGGRLGVSEAQREQWRQVEVDKRSILGYIPQVAHTYALVEGLYGIMNEHQIFNGPAGLFPGSTALLEASELSQIALERSTTARDAITVMGDLACRYGFYSAEYDLAAGMDTLLAEAGEALTVVDTQEAWMFHILPDDTGTSVAQRIPDDHVSVVANAFVIREVDPHPNPDFLYSSNLFEVAQRNGWWSPQPELQPLNFLKVFAPTRPHHRYSDTRVWRVFSLSNPDLHLSPYTDEYASEYPFSVPVKAGSGLRVSDLIAFQRDHFEGTQFSTAQGISGGPFGDPNRFDIAAGENLTFSEFPRTISLFRTSYSFVAWHREWVHPDLSLLFLCQYAPDVSTYTPIFVRGEQLAPSWTSGSMHMYSDQSGRFYRYAMDPVRSAQKALQAALFDRVKKVEKRAEDIIQQRVRVTDEEGDGRTDAAYDKLAALLTESNVVSGELVTSTYRDLLPFLLTSFRDGYHIEHLDQASVKITKLFYPRWWLEKVGYFSTYFPYRYPNPTPQPIVTAVGSVGGDLTLPGWSLAALLFLTAVLSGWVGAWVTGGLKEMEMGIKSSDEVIGSGQQEIRPLLSSNGGQAMVVEFRKVFNSRLMESKIASN
eukprot:gene24922-33415_t